MVILIFAILTFLLFKDYHKWVVVILALASLFMQFSMWMNQNMLCFLTLVMVILFPCKSRIGFSRLKEFPLAAPILFVAISRAVTNVFVDSAHRHIPSMFLEICMMFNTYIFWCVWKEKPDATLRVFVRTTILFSLVLAVYCIYEGLSRQNPYIDFMNSHGYYPDVLFRDEVRNGIKRVQGFYAIYTTVAGLSLNYICIALLALEKRLYRRNLLIVTVVLLFVMAFFTGMRSGIVSLCICLLMFASRKYFRLKTMLTLALVLVVSFALFGDFFQSFYDSIIHTDKVQGSTEEGRALQLEASLIAFNNSPLYGNGSGYTFNELIFMYPQLAGADSVWMSLMIDNGIIGILSYVVLVVACFKFCNKHNKRLIFYTAGVLCSQTIASVTHFPLYYVFIYIIIMNAMLDKQTVAKKVVNTYKSKPNVALYNNPRLQR